MKKEDPLMVVNATCDLCSELLGLRTPEIIVVNDKGVNSTISFDREEGRIYVEKKFLYGTDLNAVLASVCHETRHAYQWDEICDNMVEDPELVKKWAFEMGEDALVDDRHKLDQDIEIDATAFSAFFLEVLFNESLIYPETYKEQINTKKQSFYETLFDSLQGLLLG